MNPDTFSGYSDKINQLIATLIHEPWAIVGFFVLLAVSLFLKWKWFYVPALTIGALAVIYHYIFQRANVGDTPLLGLFVVAIFLAVIVGTYFLLIKD